MRDRPRFRWCRRCVGWAVTGVAPRAGADKSLRLVRLMAVVALVACTAVGCTGRPATHAEVIALDAKTGRTLWSSGDLPHIAMVGSASVDDAGHAVTIVGVNERNSCGDGPGVTVVLDEESGRYRSRRDSARPTEEPPPPQVDDSYVLARDADAQYQVYMGTIRVVRTDGSFGWDVDLPHSFGHKRWNWWTGAIHRGVLYVALAADNADGCGGGA